MDYVRTMFVVPAKFFPGDTRGESMIWYDAPTGAKIFPYHHGFGSSVWAKDLGVGNTVGEVPFGKRLYRSGAPPRPVAGTNFCGSVDSYLYGATPLTVARPQRADNSYLCCDQPPSLCAPCLSGVSNTTSATPGWRARFPDFQNVGSYFWYIGGDTNVRLEMTCNPPACGPSSQRMQVVVLNLNPPARGSTCELFQISTDGQQSRWLVPNDAFIWPGGVITIFQPGA